MPKETQLELPYSLKDNTNVKLTLGFGFTGEWVLPLRDMAYPGISLEALDIDRISYCEVIVDAELSRD